MKTISLKHGRVKGKEWENRLLRRAVDEYEQRKHPAPWADPVLLKHGREL